MAHHEDVRHKAEERNTTLEEPVPTNTARIQLTRVAAFVVLLLAIVLTILYLLWSWHQQKAEEQAVFRENKEEVTVDPKTTSTFQRFVQDKLDPAKQGKEPHETVEVVTETAAPEEQKIPLWSLQWKQYLATPLDTNSGSRGSVTGSARYGGSSPRTRSSVSYPHSGGYGGYPGGALMQRESPGHIENESEQFRTGITNAIPTTEARMLNDLHRRIRAHTPIQVVLDTDINTTFQGSIVAYSTHDVYAEDGQTVLIPQGAEWSGTVRSSSQLGQERIYGVWTRLFYKVPMSDGSYHAIDFPLRSIPTDSLGVAGIPGNVDTHFLTELKYAVAYTMLGITPTVAFSESEAGMNAREEYLSGITEAASQTAQQAVRDKDVHDPTMVAFRGVILNIDLMEDLLLPANFQERVR